MDIKNLRVAIVAPDASAKFGGEAILPLHYFRHLRERSVQVWMVLHSRTRNELIEILGGDIERLYFVEDTKIDILLFRLSQIVPAKIGSITFGLILRFYTQIRQKRLLKQVIKKHNILVVHEPTPVSPKTPSLIYNVGVPVIIGPMNGGMSFPEPFKYMEMPAERLFVKVARKFSYFINYLIPGKRLATTLLVANQRTADALPLARHKYNIVTLVENGVDLRIFNNEAHSSTPQTDIVKFLFIGRLVNWKAINILLDVIASLKGLSIELHILGDGVARNALETQTKELNISNMVIFHGFLPQEECAAMLADSQVLILPSLYECGGAVVLEAMAMEKPVIATNWGGPSDYINDSCGILVDPTKSIEEFKTGLKEAIIKMASNPMHREQLGKEGRKRVLKTFNWSTKIDSIISIYKKSINQT